MTSLTESATISQRETARRNPGDSCDGVGQGGGILEQANDAGHLLLYTPPPHAARRNRRTAQRRQVHPLQRPHADAQGRGGELSRSARSSPTSASSPCPTRASSRSRSSRSPSGSSRPRSSSSTSPASSRARRRARASATSSSSTSARSTRSSRSCAASRTRTSSTSPAHLDPVADIETIKTELVLADLETVTRARDKLEKLARGGDKEAKESLAVADKLLAAPERRQARAHRSPCRAEETDVARRFFLLTMKPMLFACNVAEDELATAESASPHVAAVRTVRRDARRHRGRRRLRGDRVGARRAAGRRGDASTCPTSASRTPASRRSSAPRITCSACART